MISIRGNTGDLHRGHTDEESQISLAKPKPVSLLGIIYALRIYSNQSLEFKEQPKA